MMVQPLSISVIIPVYNGERYLAEAITSVFHQSLPPTEIIVVDDGSTDSSAAVAAGFGGRVCVYTQDNAGPGAARNWGVQMAHGDLLAFLDADDLWLPDKLMQQLAYLQADSHLDCVFGQVEQFVTPDLLDEQRPILPQQPVMNGLHVGTMLIWRDSFARVGSFATRWAIGEFIDWYGRAQIMGLQSMSLPEVVMRRRIHTTNLTRRTQDRRSDYLKIIKVRLDEKRARAQKYDRLVF